MMHVIVQRLIVVSSNIPFFSQQALSWQVQAVLVAELEPSVAIRERI